jgi:hypothetical protein
MADGNFTIKIVGKDVVVKMPIDILVNAFNESPLLCGEYKVINKRQFAENLTKYLDGHGGDAETNSTGLEDLLDNLFVEMVEDAVDGIVEIEEQEDED